ncbi:hypothetical protein V8E54_001944 [Elaphomyces granulatus]
MSSSSLRICFSSNVGESLTWAVPERLISEGRRTVLAYSVILELSALIARNQMIARELAAFLGHEARDITNFIDSRGLNSVEPFVDFLIRLSGPNVTDITVAASPVVGFHHDKVTCAVEKEGQKAYPVALNLTPRHNNSQVETSILDTKVTQPSATVSKVRIPATIHEHFPNTTGISTRLPKAIGVDKGEAMANLKEGACRLSHS